MNKLENIKIIQLLFLLFLLSILNGYMFSYINSRFFQLENEAFDDLSRKEFFFAAVIFAPIIETLIFQYGLYNFLDYLKLKNALIIIVLMSFIFSLVHHYHWIYMVATFSSGLILNYLYVTILRSRGELIAVLLTTAMHSSYNLFGFLFVD